MKKTIVFLIYCALMLSMGLSLISCKKEKVTPVIHNNNNSNNTNNTPLKHSMDVDSSSQSTVIHHYFVADTNTLKMYYDPAVNYDIHIQAYGIHGGRLDIYLTKALVVNGVILPSSGTLHSTSDYAIYTSPTGQVYSSNYSYLSSTIMTYPETDNQNLHCGFHLEMQDNAGNRINLQCPHSYIKIQ